MKHMNLVRVILISIALFLLLSSQAWAIRWDFTSSLEGWTGRNCFIKHVSEGGGRLYMYPEGNDPGIVSPTLSINASTNNLIKMYIWTDCPDRDCRLYFKRLGSSTVTGGYVYLSSGMNGNTYEIDMSGNSNWYGTISQIRIDPSDSCGSPGDSGFIAFDWIETSQKVNHPPVVTTFTLDKTEISHGWNLGVTVAAYDPDGDSFSWSWKVNSGNWNPVTPNSTCWFEIPASGFSPGSNSVYVRATDVHGAYGQPSPKTVTDYLVPNGAPGTLSPSDGVELDIQSSYQFVFGAVSNAHHYQVLIDDNSNYSSPVYNNEVAGSPFYVGDSVLQSGKTYYWKICGENKPGTQGPWANTWFKIKQPNSPPVVTTFTLDKTEISHGWNLGVTVAAYDPDGDSFSWSWKVNSGNWNPVTPNGSGWFEIPASGFSPGSNSVYVRATDVHGAYGQPSPKTVTDYLVPNGAPGTLSPSDGVELDIQSSYQFVFGAVSNAHHYQVLIDDNSNYSSPDYNNEVAGSPFYVEGLQSGKTYYWKICAENKLGSQGPWTETWFKIVGLPTVSNVQVSPSSVINGDTVTIGWSSTNQNHWFIYLYDSTGINPVNTSCCLSSNCAAAGSDGSDGCLNQANPSSATLTTWTIPDDFKCDYTIKVKVWNSLGEPPAGVGSISNTFVICKPGTPPLDEPTGVLARTCDNPDVYWIKYGKKWPFVDQATFFNLGYTDAEIEWYCSGALDGFPLGKEILRDNDRFCYRSESDSTVFLIEEHESHPFFQWPNFEAQGFSAEDIYWAEPEGISWIKSAYPAVDAPMIRVKPGSLTFE